MYSRDELIHAGIYCANKMEAMDELYHYGRKGMKWGEDIFAQEYEAMKRNTNKAYALKNVSEQKQKEEQMRRAGAGGGETGAQRAARLKKELLLRRAQNADGGIVTYFDKKNEKRREEINKSPNHEIYGSTREDKGARKHTLHNEMIRNDGKNKNDKRELTTVSKPYNNEPIPKSSLAALDASKMNRNPTKEARERAGYPGEETGAEKAARMKKEALLRRAERAAEKEGKSPYKDSYEKPEVKVPDSEYYKKKYGGVGKGSDYVNKQQTANQYAEKYGGVGKGSDYVNKQVSDANREQASKKTGVGGLNIAGLKDRDAADKKLTGSNGNRNLNSSSNKVQQGGANKFSNQSKEEPSENKKYIDNINTNGKDVAKDILKNDPMFNEYLNSTSDLKIKAARESGDSLVEDLVKGNTASNSRQNAANERLGQSLINKTKKQMHDDIDSHSQGMSASQIALAKANSDTAVDEAFKELNKEREKEITGSATDRMLGRSALGKAEQEGMSKFSRSAALSTGGLNDVSGGTAGRGPNSYEKTEAPSAEVEAPKTEAPKVETPKKTEAPKVETPNKRYSESTYNMLKDGAREHGIKDIYDPITGEKIIDSADLYEPTLHGNGYDSQDIIMDSIRKYNRMKRNPDIYDVYGTEIDKTLEELNAAYDNPLFTRKGQGDSLWF